MADEGTLDFAYRYPFSSEAKEIIGSYNAGVEDRFMRAGVLRVDEDLNRKDVETPKVGMHDLKLTYLLSYVYSRMIISAIGNPLHLRKYARAEAKRAGRALEHDTLDNMMRLLSQLGVEMGLMNGNFTIAFGKFLRFSPRSDDFSLVRQSLEDGVVSMDREEAVRITEVAMEGMVMKNLPVPRPELPKEALAYAKQVRLPAISTDLKPGKGTTYRWIEKVLETPIADVRHRAVNLVLAPYLVNVKGMSEDEAAGIILQYIERCKELNPETKVNSTYVKYQCSYAKAKGMRPLSFEKAKDMFRGVIDFG